jgi:endonuclease/exonuclease/phosphatase family metal-dependent hydrolase
MKPSKSPRPPSLASLLNSVSKTANQIKLKPTATVVRGRDGRVKVERKELLSASEQDAKIEASQEAGKKRGEKDQKFQSGSLALKQGDRIFPIRDGELYEFYPDETDGESPQWKNGEWMEATHDNSRHQQHHSGGGLFGGCSSIKVATFNIWFDPHEWKKRTEALLDLLVNVELVDVICLQEVTPRVLLRILEKEDIRQAYRVTDKGPECRTLGRYGVTMLVRRSLPLPTITWLSLPTGMGRSALVVAFDETDDASSKQQPTQTMKMTMAIATVHLESLASRDLRCRQLALIRNALKPHSNAVLVGDYNISATGPYGRLSEHRNLDAVLLPDYEDLWVSEHGTHGDTVTSPEFDKHITFSATSNAMLRRKGGIPDHARLDRVFVRTDHNTIDANKANTNARIKAQGIRIIGDQAIGPNLFISDHFGLVFDLKKDRK